MQTNPCNSNWTRSGGDRPLKKEYCEPPAYSARVYSSVSESAPTGSCLDALVPIGGLCIACFVAVIKFSEPALPSSPDKKPVSDVASQFVLDYYDTAMTVQSATGVPAVILLTEALILTNGVVPSDNDIFKEGKSKNVYRSFLSHAKKCADRIGVGAIPSDPNDYIKAGIESNVYSKAGGKQVSSMLTHVQKLLK